MRKLMAALAIVLVAGLPSSSWAILGFDGISYDGSLEVGAVKASNEVDSKDGFGDGVNNDQDRRSDVDTRVRLGVNLQVTEGVDGRLEFVRTGQRYGDGASSLSTEESSILIQNAYVNWLMWNWNWRLGRQYTGRANDLVWNFGPRSDDNLSVDAVDGLALSRSWDRIAINAFLAKIDDNNSQSQANDQGEISAKMIELAFPNIVPALLNARVGAIWGSNSRSGATSDSTKLTIYRAGVDGGINENFITYRAEYLMNDGSDKSTVPAGGQEVDLEGSAYDIGVGLNIPENGAGQFALGVNYLVASGDDNGADDKDESFNDLSRVGANGVSDRYLGEIFGRSNVLFGTPQGIDFGAPGINVIHANALFKPAFAPKTWARLDWYDFTADEDAAGDWGSEIDLTFGYRHSDTVGFEVGYAQLSPDRLLEANLNDGTVGSDDVTKAFARMKVAFGGGMQAIDAR